MKRRRMIQSVLGLSASPAALLAQYAAPANAPRSSGDETPKLAMTGPDAIAGSPLKFFDPAGFEALRKLGEILVPAREKLPGAAQAEAAEFLDFLLSQSPPDRQELYRNGAARLNQEAHSRYGKSFSALSAGEAAPILAPLRQPWTYQGPSDPFAAFLVAAKHDFLTATLNSRQWAAASTGRRSASGLNTYWLPIES